MAIGSQPSSKSLCKEVTQMRSARNFTWKVVYAVLAIAALVVASGAPGGYGMG